MNKEEFSLVIKYDFWFEVKHYIFVINSLQLLSWFSDLFKESNKFFFGAKQVNAGENTLVIWRYAELTQEIIKVRILNFFQKFTDSLIEVVLLQAIVDFI